MFAGAGTDVGRDSTPSRLELALIAQLDAARADVEALFARWQELDAIKQASPRS